MDISKDAWKVRDKIVRGSISNCKDLTPEQVESVLRLHKEDEVTNESLLRIELDSMDSTPKVYYKGEEVTLKTEVAFNWKTKTPNYILNRTSFSIDHFEKLGEEWILNTIGKVRHPEQ